MNCKFGDAAMVVRNTTGDPCVPHMIGTPVVVESLHLGPDGPYWLFKGKPLQCPRCPQGMFIGFLDSDLQPLRPGPQRETTSDCQDVGTGELAHG